MNKAYTASKKKRIQKLKPIKKWQTGDYERNAEFKFFLPYQFLLLCKLMEVTPDQMLSDFMDNLSCGSWRREGRDKAKELLVQYFIEHGYGQDHYTLDDIRTIFKEMDAIGLLFPVNGKSKFIEFHAKWRDKYYNFWFKKWYKKPRKLNS